MLKNETSSNNYVQINTSEFEDFISENQSAEPKGSDDINTNPNNKGNAMMGNMKTTKEILKGQDDYVSGLAETKIKQLQIIQPETFLDSMRSSGYKSLAHAVGDLLDNSIEALSDQVHLVTELGTDETGKKKATVVKKLAVIDNGTGMSEGMVIPALSFGGTHRHGGEGLFGRYGMGLPAASIFISESVTIFSKTREMKEWFSGNLDKEAVRRGDLTNKDGLTQFKEAKVSKELPKYITDYVTKKGIALEHGTVVELMPDRLGPGFKQPASFDDKLLRYIGQTYRNFLEAVEICVNGKKVIPIDPLFLTAGGKGFDIGNKYKATERPIKSFEIKNSKGVTGRVRMRVSFLDPEGFSKQYGKGDKDKVNDRFALAKENHCLMIINRAGREIDRINTPAPGAGWNFSLVNYDRFWAMELDFEPALDEFFGVTTSKQQITIEKNVWDKLINMEVPQTVTSLRAEVEKKTKELRREASESENKEITLTSEKIAEDLSQFQRSRIQDPEEVQKEADQRLEDEAEIKAKEENRPLPEVVQEMNEETKQKRFKFMTESIIGGPFYRVERFGQQVRVYANTSHTFYNDFYMELDIHGKTCVQLLLFSLGTSQASGNKNHETFYEGEILLWSSYLNTAFEKLVSADIEAGIHSSEDIAEEIQEEREIAEENV